MSTRKLSEKKRFSLVARIKSATHAWRGFKILMRTTHNLWGHMFFGVLAVYLGFVLNISVIEWMFIIFVIGIVIITESLNTAFEIDINLTSPTYHPYAKDTKDVAAAAVLISVALALLIGSIIFLPKIYFVLF